MRKINNCLTISQKLLDKGYSLCYTHSERERCPKRQTRSNPGTQSLRSRIPTKGRLAGLPKVQKMNWKLPLLIASICLGVICVTSVANSSEEGVLRLYVLQPDAVSLNDLDVRDSNNNPVTSPESKQQLTQIFQSGLFQILTQAELYSVAAALSVIRKALNLADFSFARSLPQKTFEIFCALLPVKKNWDKLLVALSVLFVFTVTSNLLSLLPNCSTPAAKSSAPLVLRC